MRADLYGQVQPLFFLSLATLRESVLWRSVIFRALFGALAALSILINALGAFSASQTWNAHPLRVLAACVAP